ncbi:7-carboxy-7-deazaguanine synthase QueE [Kitasatospora purpeofusca]|uniref:7-carboxy-7-deazaguanine synthase QueE n=1 Tax=Kitasatospora purpeofusca TaxID=67352 RepID=UPI002252E1AF|nr:7-carboxy-7-deazaguanine synthase QueE [Kitasatospora purpeofusca]MCX4758666.1 7-carboxy-7-deazaguanine synthase QueE [Kitasatospora purpeofusca]WSR30899.1 7-carboxy-7-deazaguanine synthase QueE [Kitasatospora purpeofusca]
MSLMGGAVLGGRGLLIAECFGPTFQGEGPSVGEEALFLRLSRCNLKCPRCDTPQTWDWSRFDPREVSTRHSVEDLAAWVMSHSPRLVVVTGGEPLLQQGELVTLLQLLSGRRVEVETNGTVVPLPDLVEAVGAFNVSPKLEAFAARGDRRINPEALRALAACGKARFKFVVRDIGQLDEVDALVEEFSLTQVWIMPEGTSSAEVIAGQRALAEPVLARGWNLSTRLHTLIWEDESGR